MGFKKVRIGILFLLAGLLLQQTAARCADPFALGMEAQNHISKKEYDQAIPLLADALKQDPMNTWLRGMLANSHYQLRQFTNAKTQYGLIVEMEPENNLARFMVSVLEPLVGLEENTLVKETKQPVSELRPYEIERLYGKAVVFLRVADQDRNVFKQGSGFVISEDGWTVTNHHVIVNGKYAVARFPDGREFAVEKVLAYEPKLDLAVLKLEGATGLVTTKMGDSSKVILGEQAVAIGSPEGMEHTISDGLISAWRDMGEGYKYIQISVPISHGSSGGALFNMRGEVIGVTSAGLDRGQNLNFAIPINFVKELMKNPKPVALAELPEERPEDGEKKTEDTAADAELIRGPDGSIVCNNRNLNFGFRLSDNSWNVSEESKDGDYLLKCNSPDLQVQVHTFLAKKGLTEAELVEHYRDFFFKGDFTFLKDFERTVPGDKPAFMAQLNKEAEDPVRSWLVLMLEKGRVFVFSVWYLARDEDKLSDSIEIIRGSFQIGNAVTS